MPASAGVDVITMPGLVKSNTKRVLVDSSKAVQNGVTAKSPQSAKKRKLNGDGPSFSSSQAGPNGTKGKYGSSQPKSHFESEVLEKMTQDIHGLKQSNAEKDQQWHRPGLDDFEEKKDSLSFQQIECEEGTLHGGKTTLKLFGVTEVRRVRCSILVCMLTTTNRPVTLCSSMSPIFCIISMLQLLRILVKQIANRSRRSSKRSWHNINPPSIQSTL